MPDQIKLLIDTLRWNDSFIKGVEIRTISDPHPRITGGGACMRGAPCIGGIGYGENNRDEVVFDIGPINGLGLGFTFKGICFDFITASSRLGYV